MHKTPLQTARKWVILSIASHPSYCLKNGSHFKMTTTTSMPLILNQGDWCLWHCTLDKESSPGTRQINMWSPGSELSSKPGESGGRSELELAGWILTGIFKNTRYLLNLIWDLGHIYESGFNNQDTDLNAFYSLLDGRGNSDPSASLRCFPVLTNLAFTTNIRHLQVVPFVSPEYLFPRHLVIFP